MWKIAFGAASFAAALVAATPANAQAGAVRAAAEAARLSNQGARTASRINRALVTVIRQADLTPAAAHAQRHADQGTLIPEFVIEGTLYKIDALGAVPIDGGPDFVDASGFSNNEIEDMSDAEIQRDVEVYRELAMNALLRNTNYRPLICVSDDGRMFQVPSSWRTCADGRIPLTTTTAISLRAIPITLPPGVTERDVQQRLSQLRSEQAQREARRQEPLPQNSVFRQRGDD